MKALDHKCHSCGAVLKFNPKDQNWKCEYCESVYTIEDLKKFEKTEDYVTMGNKPSDIYKCKDCGATLIADKYTSATHCVYCGNVALIKEKLTGKFAPKFVLPFRKTKEDVISEFLKLQKGKILMPKLFNDRNNIEKISGVYVPFWLFDVNCNGNISLKGSVIKTYIVGEYLYTHTSIYNLSKKANLDFNNIALDGSSKFNDDYMHSIEPFDFGELKDYNHSYLSGFFAEIYDKTSDERYKDAEALVKKTGEEIVISEEISYSNVSVLNNDMSIKKISENYCLLPVWMVNVKYKGKQYLFAVNGQSGKMIGDIPVSIPRLIIFSVVIFAVIFVILNWVVKF